MTAYTYDPAGNRKTETVTLSGQATTIEYTVDSLNRLTKTVTQEEHTTVTNTYCYDPTGNLISRVPEVLKSAVQNELPSLSLAASLGTEDLPVALYTYNQRNQMIIAEVGTQRVENTFNAEGLRVSKTANGVTAQYQYEYDKIVKEIDSEGNTVYNIYGINLISREVGGQKLFYLYNGHSDVTALVNRMGQVVKTYYYDAFGNAVEESGSCANPYRYAGYRYDEESGLYDLKARFYDATVARFMQEDTYGAVRPMIH